MVFEPSTAWRVRLPVISYKWWETSRAKNRSSQREAGGESDTSVYEKQASGEEGGTRAGGEPRSAPARMRHITCSSRQRASGRASSFDEQASSPTAEAALRTRQARRNGARSA